MSLPARSPHASRWALDDDVVFLNHGSFGACPGPVVAAQRAWQDRAERQPMQFFARDLPDLLGAARAHVASLVRADPDGLAFVSNATEGVNAVLRSVPLRPGDAVLVTDQAYAACHHALVSTARAAGAEVHVAPLPFPVDHPERITESILGRVTPKTRLALIDHVTSPTGLVLPVETLVPALESRGVRVLVDGAHAPGMLPLALDDLAPSWYTANFHKWLCAPRGAAMLWSREDVRALTRPVSLSHAASLPGDDPARYLAEFDWTGTRDFSPWLTLPTCTAFLGALHPDGLPGLQTRNHQLVLAGRDLLCRALDIPPPAPDSMLGSLASVPLPPGRTPRASPWAPDPLQRALLDRWKVEVPVHAWPSPTERVLRISAQAYNSLDEFEYLAAALPQALAAERD
ncbi:MAG: aminotransferase class V-fold PLP-dependent enzyme [Deltaproteobacteria bacterium]|nr:MAG: aminotransferase class V-fold PLP-dependent enzyme [Deltaproteobacteria bacterium]